MRAIKKTIHYVLLVSTLLSFSVGNAQDEATNLKEIYAVSSTQPRQLISFSCEAFIADDDHVYLHQSNPENDVICSILPNLPANIQSKKEIQHKLRDQEPLSPLLLSAKISFTNSFVTNILDDAGNCYILPKACPLELKKIDIANLPEEYALDKCSAVSYQNKLVLRLINTKLNKTGYAFFDVQTRIMEKPFFPEGGELSSSICWRGDNLIWEISRSKRGYFFYTVYDIKMATYVKKGDSKIDGNWEILVFGKSLLLANEKGKIQKIYPYR